MAKIVLDPEESAIEAFAKLFFSATRNMGLSDKEACEALRKSAEAIENAPAEEKYDWYGSPANIERILQREFKMKCRKMTKNWKTPLRYEFEQKDNTEENKM